MQYEDVIEVHRKLARVADHILRQMRATCVAAAGDNVTVWREVVKVIEDTWGETHYNALCNFVAEIYPSFENDLNVAFAYMIRERYAREIQRKTCKIRFSRLKVKIFMQRFFPALAASEYVCSGEYFLQTQWRNAAVEEAMRSALYGACDDLVRKLCAKPTHVRSSKSGAVSDLKDEDSIAPTRSVMGIQHMPAEDDAYSALDDSISVRAAREERAELAVQAAKVREHKKRVLQMPAHSVTPKQDKTRLPGASLPAAASNTCTDGQPDVERSSAETLRVDAALKVPQGARAEFTTKGDLEPRPEEKTIPISATKETAFQAKFQRTEEQKFTDYNSGGKISLPPSLPQPLRFQAGVVDEIWNNMHTTQGYTSEEKEESLQIDDVVNALKTVNSSYRKSDSASTALPWLQSPPKQRSAVRVIPKEKEVAGEKLTKTIQRGNLQTQLEPESKHLQAKPIDRGAATSPTTVQKAVTKTVRRPNIAPKTGRPAANIGMNMNAAQIAMKSSGMRPNPNQFSWSHGGMAPLSGHDNESLFEGQDEEGNTDLDSGYY